MKPATGFINSPIHESETKDCIRILLRKLELACTRGFIRGIFSHANTFQGLPSQKPPLQARSSLIPRMPIWCIVFDVQGVASKILQREQHWKQH